VLPSLSRLIDQGIGEGYTDADHPALASQLYAAYARANQIRTLAKVVGEEGLPAGDRLYLDFGNAFERDFVHQEGARVLEESLDIGWNLLAMLPAGELSRLSDEQIARHLAASGATDG
jgi:V/A-type H+-transporting ATPase subunit B